MIPVLVRCYCGPDRTKKQWPGDVGHPCPRPGVSRVAYAFLVYMLPPLPRRSGWAYCFAHSPQPYQPSPKGLSGRPAHRPFRGLLGVYSRYGLHTRAVTVYRDTLTRGFSHFVTSMTAPVASERLPGGTYTHWKAPPCHGAHPARTLVQLARPLFGG